MVVGPASASGGGKAKGSVTCDLASSFRFSPPLAPGIGTKGFKQEIVTMGREALSDCTGSVTHGALPTAGAQMGAAKIKIKGLTHVPPGNGKAAGGCPAFLNLAWPKLKANYTWTSSPADAKTKVKVAKGGTWGSNDGLYTLTFSGKAKGSFSGTVAIDAVFEMCIRDRRQRGHHRRGIEDQVEAVLEVTPSCQDGAPDSRPDPLGGRHEDKEPEHRRSDQLATGRVDRPARIAAVAQDDDSPPGEPGGHLQGDEGWRIPAHPLTRDDIRSGAACPDPNGRRGAALHRADSHNLCLLYTSRCV